MSPRWTRRDAPFLFADSPFFKVKSERAWCPTVQRDTASDSSTCILPMWMRRPATVVQLGDLGEHPNAFTPVGTGRKAALECAKLVLGFSMSTMGSHFASPLRGRTLAARQPHGAALARTCSVGSMFYPPCAGSGALGSSHRHDNSRHEHLTPQLPHQLASQPSSMRPPAPWHCSFRSMATPFRTHAGVLSMPGRMPTSAAAQGREFLRPQLHDG